MSFTAAPTFRAAVPCAVQPAPPCATARLLAHLRETGSPADWQRYGEYVDHLRQQIAANRLALAVTLFAVGLQGQGFEEADIRDLSRQFDRILWAPRERTALMRALNNELADAAEYAAERKAGLS